MSSVGPAVSAFSLGGLHQSRWCDLHLIGGWDIFQNSLIGECGQGLHHMTHFPQVHEACLGSVAGLFQPNVGGPLHRPGSSGLCQPEVLAAESHILEGQELVPV